MTQYREQVQQIAAFAARRGYDLANMDKPMLDEIMKEWLKDSQQFYKKLQSLEAPAQRAILGIK